MEKQSIVEFLSNLRGLDVRVWSDSNQLRVSAPDGVLTPEIQAEIKKRKADILAFLVSAREAAQTLPAIQPALPQGDANHRLHSRPAWTPATVGYS